MYIASLQRLCLLMPTAMAHMCLSSDWTLSGAGLGKLGLSCVFCAGGDVIYIFSATPFGADAKPTVMLPRDMQELLIFEPVVPLRYTNAGFQALLPSEWADMSAERDLYVGLQTRSSAVQSAASLDGDLEAEAFEDAQESASSCDLDGHDAGALERAANSSEASGRTEEISEGSDVESNDSTLRVPF
jgi:hypothetical protein